MLYNANGEKIDGIFSALPSMVIVAASDSADADKICADYVCDGTNDEVEIQAAIDSLPYGGTVFLSTGNYYIDGWSENTSEYKTAIAVKNTEQQKSIKISGASFPLRKYESHDLCSTAIVRVTSSALDALTGSETRVSIIGYGGTSRTYPKFVLDVCNIGITLADNQHPAVCLDGKYFSAMMVENVFFGIDTNAYNGTDGAEDYDIPVDGCIAMRGTDGSNFGAGYRIANCFAWGFGVAYELNGEHLIMEQCGCRFCNYSYTFGNNKSTGANLHDLTLINCCHEFCMRYPVFNNSGQAVSLINYNVEDDANGKFATVSKATAVSGAYGSVTYTICDASSWKNISGVFFEEGYGEGFICRNFAE